MLKIDLTKKNGSIGHMLVEHRDEILFSSSVQDMANKVRALLEAEKINTPKSREIMFNLEHGKKSLASAQLYVQNIIFKAQKMGA